MEKKNQNCKFWIKINWNSPLKANVGGDHSPGQTNTVYKIVLFDCLLVGSIVWMAYQGSLTSELTIVKLKLPFIDPETLYKSDYK